MHRSTWRHRLGEVEAVVVVGEETDRRDQGALRSLAVPEAQIADRNRPCQLR